MASLQVFDRTGKKVGKYDVDPDRDRAEDQQPAVARRRRDVSGEPAPGSARTRSRAEVSGSTKKMYRQKGTGNARAGSRRSGIRRGGGHIFAKRPRDYSYRLPRKAVQSATRMAIASKIRDEQMVVIDDLRLTLPRPRKWPAF